MMDIKFSKSFPVLETERLILREITISDSQCIFDNFSNIEIVKHFMKPFTSIEESIKMISFFTEKFKNQKGIYWGITLKVNNIFIGTCSFEKLDPIGCGEIGYDLSTSHWKKGYMTEALECIIQYGFENLDLKTIEAFIAKSNINSINLIKKLNFNISDEEEKHYRFSLFKNN